MLILAADTSTPYLSVALCHDDKVLAERTELAERRHAEQILQWVDAMLRDTDTTLHDIDLFAVSIGPGSFTGLRVGVSAWKGLAAGIDKPIVGVSTLDGLAMQYPLESGHLCAMLDAKMGEVYGALYAFESGTRILIDKATVGSIESVISRCPSDTIFIGDGATKFADTLSTHFPEDQIITTKYDAPTATSIAHEAYQKHAGNDPISTGHVAPLYLRKSQAEENRDRQNAAETAS